MRINPFQQNYTTIIAVGFCIASLGLAYAGEQQLHVEHLEGAEETHLGRLLPFAALRVDMSHRRGPCDVALRAMEFCPVNNRSLRFDPVLLPFAKNNSKR